MKNSKMDSKIKLFIIKSEMKRDLMEASLRVREKSMRKLLGNKYCVSDPWNEEDWES